MYKNPMRAIGAFLLAVCLTGCALFSDQSIEPSQPGETQLSTTQGTTSSDLTVPTTSTTTMTTDATTVATTAATTASTTPENTVETTAETTQPTKPTEAEVEHSPLYIPGVDVEDVIKYFNEVCLDAEYVNGGNASLLQRWDVPIRFIIQGEPTEEDRTVLSGVTSWLNTV